MKLKLLYSSLICVITSLTFGLSSCDNPIYVASKDETMTEHNNIWFGAYWYPWYGKDGWHWEEGYLGEPVLGEYDSSAREVINQQANWAKDSGLSFFVASWWGIDTYEDRVIKDAIHEYSTDSDFKYAILYESTGLLDLQNGWIELSNSNNQAKFLSDFKYLAEKYFPLPGYLRINERPVVFIYLTRIFTGDIAKVMGEVRSAIIDSTGENPYLIGDEVYWHSPVASRISPYDGVTAYNMHTSVPGIAVNFPSKVEAVYSEWKKITDDIGVAFIPDVLPGFDDTAVRPEANHPIIERTPDQFKEQLISAVKLASGEQRMVVVTSWNEWHEYTSIEPSQEFGQNYLDILKFFTFNH